MRSWSIFCRGLKRLTRASPVSITKWMPGTVSDVSATLVASTMRRCEAGSKTRSCSSADRREKSGRISVPFGWCLRSVSAASRISRSPGRKTRMSPAAALAGDLVHGLGDGLVHVHGLVVLVLHLEELGAVADFHRIGAAGDLDHRRAAEEVREALRVDGGRGDDHLELGPGRDQALQVAEEEVDVEAALVGLVDDDRVVGAQLAVRVRLREEDPVGHHLQHRLGAGPVLEADLVADEALRAPRQLVGQARGEAARGDAARLRAPDEARGAALERQADLRDLGRLPRARLAADDRDRVLRDEGRDVVALLRDGQVVGKARVRQPGEARARRPCASARAAPPAAPARARAAGRRTRGRAPWRRALRSSGGRPRAWRRRRSSGRAVKPPFYRPVSGTAARATCPGAGARARRRPGPRSPAVRAAGGRRPAGAARPGRSRGRRSR